EGKTSLVAKWAAELAHQDWPGCDAVFAWSFYSQGTREQTAASSDAFLAEALVFFGDPATAESSKGAFDKGRRLARLVGERRALIILDGLEPLQYPPRPPMDGKLKDDGISELLKGLAATSLGLCVVTTRYALPDLRAYWQTTAPMHELPRLSTAAGVKLLRTIGVKTGSQADFEKLVEDVDGHALTLQILGQFLVRAYHGDIRRRDHIDLQKADAKIQGGHAFRAMEAYVKWMEDDSQEARREVALLKLLGLFDRPATADCVAALLKAPAIPGLTEPLVGLAEDDWEWSLSVLRDAKLLTVNREEGSGVLVALDAHPLLREYFAQRVRQQQPDAWRAAHRRLYEHLCATTKDKSQPNLEDLQPLYQAVAHGCRAGCHRDAYSEVYLERILRGTDSNGFYATSKLGLFGLDYDAVWHLLGLHAEKESSTAGLDPESLVFLLHQAAFDLRSLGRPKEAVDRFNEALLHSEGHNEWEHAARISTNLSETLLLLGCIDQSLAQAERSLKYATRSRDRFRLMDARQALGICQLQGADPTKDAPRLKKAEQNLGTAERQRQTEERHDPRFVMREFQFCEFLLHFVEIAAWKSVLGICASPSEEAMQRLEEVGRVATLAKVVAGPSVQSGTRRALNNLSLARAALCHAILEGRAGCPQPTAGNMAATARRAEGCTLYFATARSELDAVVAGLRRAGTQDHLPRGLLTRAWLRSLEGRRTGSESAQSDLDEAWEIAERGPMKLHMADIHLHRARLFFREAKCPWESPQADLTAAEKLINACGYHRRDEELEDARKAILP
ncbi:MAG: hypothetical protein L0Z50_41560, partial [Verrucomicrobiales bacterium]|nr:hypothetical protein [Verrucomicrobiales bacterium]